MEVAKFSFFNISKDQVHKDWRSYSLDVSSINKGITYLFFPYLIYSASATNLAPDSFILFPYPSDYYI